MALLGTMALGIVMGWVSVLLGRRTSGLLGVSWRAAAFAVLALAGAGALAFIHAGSQGAFIASIAFGAGIVAAATVLGIRAAENSTSRQMGG
jgi:hypothetical protein